MQFPTSFHLGHFNASGRRAYVGDDGRILDSEWAGEHVLPVVGVVVDTVCRVVGDARHDEALAEVAKLDAEGNHPLGLSHLQVFFRTMVFDYRGFLSEAGSNAFNRDWMKRLAFGFYRELEDFNVRGRGASGFTFGIKDFLGSISLPLGGVQGGRDDWAAQFAESSKDRREVEAFRTEYLYRSGYKAIDASSSFFITEKSHTGLGPARCQEGDHLAIFHGCPTPLVVRSARERIQGKPTYQVVGPCYLYGMMNGEMFDKTGVVTGMYLV